jgi:hypothetical protein
VKICKKCGVEKPLDQFRANRNGWRRGECRECERKTRLAHYASDPKRFSAAARTWSRTHPAQRNAAKRAWYAKNKQHHKQVVRHRMYGIAPEEYARLLAEQGGVCAGCRGHCKTGRALAVDHNHLTGRVRALLCNRCNHVLGLVGDAEDILISLSEVVKKRERLTHP